jgi:hypothetical protein
LGTAEDIAIVTELRKTYNAILELMQIVVSVDETIQNAIALKKLGVES